VTLAPGTRLGPYEIVAAVGAGGMGEVYRARDTRLERTVAVKVLPSHLAASTEVRQRFEREAKTISSLSHPNICALYDVGNQDGVEFLVMEYLEGETVSDRLAKGPLAFDSVLRYGLEIADALDKAHRQGIVHRDLKPGNVMLTKSGVKLLDFGLAKMVAPSAARSGASLTALPTEARGSNLTEEGTILGTFQYMAPEQLEGRDADARTDIFAFGAVLYEMATGKKAFSGRSQASLISSIMGSEPPAVSTVAPMTPPAFDRVVRTCLAKDPDDRWQTAHDIGVQLKWIQEGGSAVVAAPSAAAPRKRSPLLVPWLVAAVATAGLIALAVRDRLRPVAPGAVVRFAVLPPEKAIFTPPGEHAASQFALSPDGRSLAFVASYPGARSLLWVRRFDSLTASPLPGTEEAMHPFWSPDGRSVGFFTPTAVKRVDLASGAPQKLCDSAGGRGGAWSQEGVIIFADSAATHLFRVPDLGGEWVPATRVVLSSGLYSQRYQ
jgi:predicted Ser/Thr protein kinase